MQLQITCSQIHFTQTSCCIVLIHFIKKIIFNQLNQVKRQNATHPKIIRLVFGYKY
jgi:hypothetical protein